MIQKTTAVFAITGVLVTLLLCLRPRGTIAPSAPVGVSSPAASAPGASALPIADVSAYVDLHSARTSAQQDVHIVEALVQNFQLSLKTSAVPPLGFNDEITRALTGRNPLQLAFIPPAHPAINARGELCDRWGTPYSFHPVAADRIDVRSAGPDKRLFTADDVTTASLRTVTVE